MLKLSTIILVLYELILFLYSLHIHLKNNFHHNIFTKVIDLPKNWDDFAVRNVFLSVNYLKVLEESAPINMQCFFIAIYEDEKLMGIAIAQFLDGNQMETFGNRDRCVKTFVRNFTFKNFSSQILFIGNNMLTGQNAFSFSSEANPVEALKELKNASQQLKIILYEKGEKVHLTSFKDFTENDLPLFEQVDFSNFYRFQIQPNMVFYIKDSWHSIDDYVKDLTKKYRDQYKRSRKKAIDIEKRKLDLQEILRFEEKIYDLYFHVAKNAPFNTFLLHENHFSSLKRNLNHDFLFYGYFLNGELIGFNTLVKNGDTMDTYFLGYDEKMQREKMLYLNMLHDMIGYSIKKRFKKIIFGRTALEIKSSVGAQPEPMFGYIKHSNALLQSQMPRIFNSLQPAVTWQMRNPFKEDL
ncbi:8-amino-7-oxononanoate synthase [Flavobacterium sp. SM2513]|uniref:8-amino-7-oxononanoate synthase n=1 Tax=Flavobacterium sp. SM2513 TaxID=3424766 RepID=UPI003D7F694A